MSPWQWIHANVTGFVQKELVSNLLKECVKMHKLMHPNVLKLTGVCLDGGPAPYLIIPYMANGNLLSYLKEHRDTLIVGSNVEQVELVNELIVNLCLACMQ